MAQLFCAVQLPCTLTFTLEYTIPSSYLVGGGGKEQERECAEKLVGWCRNYSALMYLPPSEILLYDHHRLLHMQDVLLFLQLLPDLWWGEGRREGGEDICKGHMYMCTHNCFPPSSLPPSLPPSSLPPSLPLPSLSPPSPLPPFLPHIPATLWSTSEWPVQTSQPEWHISLLSAAS